MKLQLLKDLQDVLYREQTDEGSMGHVICVFCGECCDSHYNWKKKLHYRCSDHTANCPWKRANDVVGNLLKRQAKK